jgi:hypothetical protein
MHNARMGLFVVASLSGAGSDTQVAHTTITDNEVMENGALGIFMLSLGDHNVLSNTTIARNTVSGNALVGINVQGGFFGADGNTLNVHIRDNTVTDNGAPGIRVSAGADNSSNNHVVARIRGNTLERNQGYGIVTHAGEGAFNLPAGTSNNNVVDVRLERNTVRSQTGSGIFIGGGIGSPDGRANAVADGNQTSATVSHNTIADNTDRGIELIAGGPGLASSNTVEVRIVHNTVCHNGTDIVGEGGFSGNVLLVPNMGTGNVLEGEISKNTATTVTVQDGAGAPGNQANVTQFNNDLCP